MISSSSFEKLTNKARTGLNTTRLENNSKLSSESLRVHEAVVGASATIKRMSSRARGSSSLLRKRTSHIKIILSDE